MPRAETPLRNLSWLIVVLAIAVVLPLVLVEGQEGAKLSRAAGGDAVLEVRVLDAEGAPAPHARIEVVPEGDGAATVVTTDAEGRWSGRLERGRYHVAGIDAPTDLRNLVELDDDARVVVALTER